MDTVEFWVVHAMDIDYPRVTIIERADTYAEADQLLTSLNVSDPENWYICVVTPIKRGDDK